MLITVKMLVRFQMDFNLSCNSDLAQTLVSESCRSLLSALSVSHNPQESTTNTIQFAVEEKSIILGLYCFT